MQSSETGDWIESSRVRFRDGFNKHEYNWKRTKKSSVCSKNERE